MMRCVPTTPDPAVQGFKDFCISIMNDVLAETGGTPDKKPQVYAKIDPNQQTDIRIPIISIYGAKDTICPPASIIAYHQALADAGHADLHSIPLCQTERILMPQYLTLFHRSWLSWLFGQTVWTKNLSLPSILFFFLLPCLVLRKVTVWKTKS